MRPITREHFLWATIAATALLVRATALNFPLADAEAQASLAALHVARGGAVVLHDPLFGFLQSLIMFIFGDSNVVVRMVSVAGGVALCLWPLMLRESLGRARALTMAVLLSISPTAMFVSREALGGGVAWMLAALATTRIGGPRMRAVLLGLLVACGVDGVAPLLVVLLVLVMSGRLNELRAVFAGRGAAIVGAAFLAGATGMFFRPRGLVDVFDGWAAWLVAGLEANRLLLGLLFGEPLLLLFAAAAAVTALVARVRETPLRVAIDMASLRFGIAWMSAGLVAVLLLPSRSAANVTAIVIGAAALASEPLARLATGLLQRRGWATWAVAGLSFALLQFVGIGLRQYVSQEQAAYLLPVLIAVVMAAGVLAAAALNEQLDQAWLGLGGALAVTLVLYSLGVGVRLTQYGWDQVTEPYVARAPQQGAATLSEVVQAAAVQASGDVDGVAVHVDESAPAVLRWALRDSTKVTYGATIGSQDIVLLPAAKKPSEDRAFVGSRFRIERGAVLQPISNGMVEMLRWALFRKGGTTGQTDVYWTLWVTNSMAARMSGR